MTGNFPYSSYLSKGICVGNLPPELGSRLKIPSSYGRLQLKLLLGAGLTLSMR